MTKIRYFLFMLILWGSLYCRPLLPQQKISRNQTWNAFAREWNAANEQQQTVWLFMQEHEHDEKFKLDVKGVHADADTLIAIDKAIAHLNNAQEHLRALREDLSTPETAQNH